LVPIYPANPFIAEHLTEFLLTCIPAVEHVPADQFHSPCR